MSPDMNTQTYNGVEADTQTTPRLSPPRLSAPQTVSSAYQHQSYYQQPPFPKENPSQNQTQYSNYPQGQPPYALNPQAYGQQVGSYGPSDTVPPQDKKGWSITKLVSHVLGIVVSVVTIGLSASFFNSYDYSYLAYGMVPIAGIAFLWHVAELITYLVRKRTRGIHPGAHVGMSLFIWLAAAVLTGLGGATVSFDYDDDCSYDDDSINDPYDDPSSYDPDDCNPNYHSQRTLYIAAIAFTGLLCLLHFFLFVGACVDTHRRNTWKGRQIIYVPQPMQWGPGAEGWQRMALQNNSGGAIPPLETQQESRMAVPPVKDQERLQPQQRHMGGQDQDAMMSIPLQERTPSPMSTQNEKREYRDDAGVSELGSDASRGKGKQVQGEGEDYTQHQAEGSGSAPRVVEYYGSAQ